MNRLLKTSTALLIAILMTTGVSYAQNKTQQQKQTQNKECTHKAHKGDHSFIPDLTEEQKESIKKIKLQLKKDMLPIQNLIREKEAKLITLESAETPDMDKINKLIDEIYAEKAKLRKLKVKAHQDIRNLLTEDQKIIFDSHYANKSGKGHQAGARKQNPHKAHPQKGHNPHKKRQNCTN